LALTVASINKLFAAVPGAKKLIVAEITGDAAYATGGSAISADLFGLTKIDSFVPLSTSSLTVEAKWDQANSKLKLATTSTGAEVGNGSDQSAVKIYALVIGR
jgi:hypothetical protein